MSLDNVFPWENLEQELTVEVSWFSCLKKSSAVRAQQDCLSAVGIILGAMRGTGHKGLGQVKVTAMYLFLVLIEAEEIHVIRVPR